jgi:hypothetical protein
MKGKERDCPALDHSGDRTDRRMERDRCGGAKRGRMIPGAGRRGDAGTVL